MDAGIDEFEPLVSPRSGARRSVDTTDIKKVRPVSKMGWAVTKVETLDLLPTGRVPFQEPISSRPGEG